jgi:hypothetical protein
VTQAHAITAASVLEGWPPESREAAELVIEKYGAPHEMTESLLVWHGVGPWKRVVATRTFYEHAFPIQHIDAVESFIDYRVPVDKVDDLAAFDGSVVVERTAGELSARCHDEEANFLALNLAHDIVTGTRDVEDARRYYAEEFLNYRRKQPTPYMDGLRFQPSSGGTADPDEPLLTQDDLEQARREGRE